jgi:hypothetical protein
VPKDYPAVPCSPGPPSCPYSPKCLEGEFPGDRHSPGPECAHPTLGSYVALCPANYYCPGALKAVPRAVRIISMPSLAVNSGVVLIALRCPRLAAADAAAPAAAASGAS